eukprot:3133524-Pyramimonas_sp.AAC.1
MGLVMDMPSYMSLPIEPVSFIFGYLGTQLLLSLRKAVEYFEKLENVDFQVATLNRVGLTLLQRGEYK